MNATHQGLYAPILQRRTHVKNRLHRTLTQENARLIGIARKKSLNEAASPREGVRRQRWLGDLRFCVDGITVEECSRPWWSRPCFNPLLRRISP